MANGNRRHDWNERREPHFGQRSETPHLQAVHMDASDREQHFTTRCGKGAGEAIAQAASTAFGSAIS